jgi:hypothetical protein
MKRVPRRRLEMASAPPDGWAPNHQANAPLAEMRARSSSVKPSKLSFRKGRGLVDAPGRGLGRGDGQFGL